MKKIFRSSVMFLTLMFALAMPTIAQDTLTTEQPPPIEDVVNEVIKVITNDSTAVISIPGAFDPSNPASVFEWWMFIFALLMPIGLWVLHKVWPSQTKKTLILKSTSIAIIVLLIIVYSNGASLLVIGQAVLAFIMKVFSYDKLLQPIGLDSPKPRNYQKE